MHILRIEHPVLNFEGWKKAFDNDPVDRKKSGVKAYHIFRPVDDDKFVMIDLDFATFEEANAMLSSLHQLWKRVEGSVMTNPNARIVEVVEQKEL